MFLHLVEQMGAWYQEARFGPLTDGCSNLQSAFRRLIGHILSAHQFFSFKFWDSGIKLLREISAAVNAKILKQFLEHVSYKHFSQQ